MAGRRSNPRSDAVQALERGCQLLRAFEGDEDVLRLRDLVARTALHKATASRLIRTLEGQGFVERIGANRFRSLVRLPVRERHRIGFATRGTDTAFSRVVTASVQRAAAEASIELVTINSHRNPRTALRNAEALAREGVELVIEFQCHASIAPMISSRFLEAGIPVIAIEVPHPGATYFGANNGHAGMLGGQGIGRWIQRHWRGQVDCVYLLFENRAGPLVRLRVTGMLAGLREVLPQTDGIPVVEIDGRGSLEKSLEALRKHLRFAPPQRTAVLAGADPMALAAVCAFEEAGRARLCAVMGQNASEEARAELRRPGSPLVGSVAYFPERYGDHIIPLAAAILAKKAVPAAVFTKHELITRENVDRIYPSDPVLPETLIAPLAPA